MNFVFDSDSKLGRSVGFRKILVGSTCLILVGVFLSLGWIFLGRSGGSGEGDPLEVMEGVQGSIVGLRAVSDSFGVPYGPVVRLAEFFAEGEFSGVGLFKVKPDHLGLLQGRFVPGAEVDLGDPVMNANIALGLLSSFHARGYSWEQSFLIYVYGWGELAPATRSVKAQEFLDFVFGGGLDG
jgi:hypothetical protein